MESQKFSEDTSVQNNCQEGNLTSANNTKNKRDGAGEREEERGGCWGVGGRVIAVKSAQHRVERWPDH